MANNLYTTKTAAVKATKADINKIDAKKMLLNGKNILDYIGDSEFNSYDTRDPQLKNDELDIWNTEISLSDNGHIEVKPHVHGITEIKWDSSKREYIYTYEGMTETQHNTLKTAAKVINNEVLGANNEHIMFWQTDGLTNGSRVLYNCVNLTSFSSDLSSLTNGADMFAYNVNLSQFDTDLPKLTNGSRMFAACNNFTSFSSDLSSLSNGSEMFNDCDNLIEFSSDLPSLTNGYYMFNACNNFTSFSSVLSNLTNGDTMFYGCHNLTSFNSNLSSLMNGSHMFEYCNLDAQSVANIVHTLPIHESNGTITIGIGCDNTEADQLLFAQECDCETWQELLDEFDAKNWTVTFQCNGRPTTTYNMRRGETLPIYAKLEEVTDEKYAQYTSADGSKFFNINYFHSTNGSTEGYDVFSSLEEAISTYNVTPKN